MQEEENNKETNVNENDVQNEKRKNEVSLVKYIVILAIMIVLIIILIILNLKQDSTEVNTIDTSNTVTENSEEIEATEGTETAQGTEITDQDEIEAIIEEIEESGAWIFENADFYIEGDFDTTTISNELILKLAWNAIVDEIANEYDYRTDGYSADGIEVTSLDDTTATGTITISQEKMNEKIVEIFGDEIIYTDESFDNEVDYSYFWTFREGVVDVTYEDDVYFAEYTEGGGSRPEWIEEYAYKMIEYEDSIEIYVKMYVVKEDEESEDYAFCYYDGYDFTQDDETGLGEEIEISGDEISETELENIETTYKYTFAIDSETGDYYLSGFCEVTE